jgi:uncharacterized repeat protein (TIGR01451 family)
MKNLPIFLSLIAILTLSFNQSDFPELKIAERNHTSIQVPVLKWQNGGCYSSWCETGWYSSPAVADLDGDGSMEVIASTYSIFVLDGASGNLEWQVASGHDRSQPSAENVGRTWPGVAIADVDANGDLEIITAHSGGHISVYDHNGYFEPGWPRVPTSRELRGLSLYDLEGDGRLEIITTGAVYERSNTWVYSHNGNLLPGWPQLSNDSGYAHGVFNDNAAVGDLDKDGFGEIVVPSDVHYVCAYERNGSQIPTHPMYGDKGWGKVGVWESLEIELRGWGTCINGDEREERFRPNFAHGASLIADVNNDGQHEVIVVGNVYDCIPGYPSQYNGLYIFNSDRSRFKADGFDWRSPPIDSGKPLSQDYSLIENNQPNPAVADLDGDGNLEIIYSSYDGRVHAYWLDKTEHGNWPYSVYDPGEGFFRFASEPVIADLDDNGLAEVLFVSWPRKGTNQTGKLHILDFLGNLLHEVTLPPAYGSPDWNGALAAPTLANIDNDPDLEIVLTTSHSGVAAYDLPSTANARIIWGTGRGNYQRNGFLNPGSLNGSSISANHAVASPGDLLEYTILLKNSGDLLPNVTMTNTLPTEVTYAGNLSASSGTYNLTENQMIWHGAISTSQPVTITYSVMINEYINSSAVIINSVQIDDGQGKTNLIQASTFVNGSAIFIPFIIR